MAASLIGTLVAFLILFAIYYVVFVVMRGGARYARRNNVRVQHRLVTRPEPPDQMVPILNANGWVQTSAWSPGGDATFANGPLTLNVSLDQRGGTNLAFLGLVCNRTAAPSYEQLLAPIFGAQQGQLPR